MRKCLKDVGKCLTGTRKWLPDMRKCLTGTRKWVPGMRKCLTGVGKCLPDMQKWVPGNPGLIIIAGGNISTIKDKARPFGLAFKI